MNAMSKGAFNGYYFSSTSILKR